MAGRALIVDMGDDHLLPAWRTVMDVARTGISAELTLVGGLMVAAHANRAGVVMRRPTDDLDALVDYWAHRGSLIAARGALSEIGFELAETGEHAYRFIHADGRKVDIMVADHLPSRMRPRLGQRPAFAALAGEQAIRRRDTYTLTFNVGGSVVLGVPDELGAMVAKGSAYLVDARDRDRHLDDSAVLLACVADASELAYDTLSTTDRRRLRAVLRLLDDPRHPSWVNVDPGDRERGLLNATLIRGAIE